MVLGHRQGPQGGMRGQRRVEARGHPWRGPLAFPPWEWPRLSRGRASTYPPVYVGTDGRDTTLSPWGKNTPNHQEQQSSLDEYLSPIPKYHGGVSTDFSHNINSPWVAHLTSKSFHIYWKHKQNCTWRVRFKKATHKSLIFSIFCKRSYNTQLIRIAKL